ncbi:MAG TPA: hypothetical protein VK586_22445, partial [Streptosporangiaceae bacterium]|nr:hypothetical protein [Streptosporangiaceae bacterium]
MGRWPGGRGPRALRALRGPPGGERGTAVPHWWDEAAWDEAARAELTRLAGLGVGTLVDLTVIGL